MEVYLGIDWSERSHTAVFVDGGGKELCQRTVEHSRDGFGELDKLRSQLGVAPDECVVGLETAHNLVVDWLWGHGYNQVYVIPPNVTRSRQASYRQSGARTDESDGYLIGNLLRTDRHRLIPWQPDSDLTQRLRAKVRMRRQLVTDKVVHLNQLRQLLHRYYPAALEVFDLKSYIGLDFIQRYPTPATAQALTYSEFEAFARAPLSSSQRTATAYARLKTEQPQALPVTVAAYQEEAVMLAQMLTQVKRYLSQTEKSIAALFGQHPDASIFASLPGAGAYLAPALLVKFGDHRSRFPTAAQFRPWPALVRLRSRAANGAPFISARLATMSSEPMPNSGLSPLSSSPLGPSPMWNKPAVEDTRTTMLVGLWPTVGWQSCGSSGRRASAMTSPIIWRILSSSGRANINQFL